MLQIEEKKKDGWVNIHLRTQIKDQENINCFRQVYQFILYIPLELETSKMEINKNVSSQDHTTIYNFY